MVTPSTSSLWEMGAGAAPLDLTDQLASSSFALAATVGLVATLFGVGTVPVVVCYLHRLSIGEASRATWVVIVIGLLLVNEPVRVFVFEALTFVVVTGTVAALSVAGLLLVQA